MAKKASTKAPSGDIKARILEAALPDVAFDGWTDELMARAAARLKISDSAVAEEFPGGPIDLLRYFSVWTDTKMAARLNGKKFDSLRIRDKIGFGVEARLDILTPYKAAVGAGLAAMAMPPRSFQLPKMVWKTADIIWRAAGDTSTDYNHYTKRLLLSGVITSTVLFWLNDDSENAARTKEFLQRRIDNVLKIGGAIGKLKKRTEGGR